MQRREFVGLLTTAAATWPVMSRAQQPARPIIGFLSSYSQGAFGKHLFRAFVERLNEAGYRDGRGIIIETKWADGRYERLPGLAADLLRARLSVLVASGGSASAHVAKAATETTPIVFILGGDPVKLGLVRTLARPGGNVTGVTTLSPELVPKRLELLHQLVPPAAVIGVLLNPTNPNSGNWSRDLQAAARTLGRRIHLLPATTEREIEAAFASLRSLRAGGLVVGGDPFLNEQSERLAALSLRYAVPTIFQFRLYAQAGGLMSYGGDLRDLYRQAANYTGRILAGAKPGDLPVQQRTKIELIFNLRTAQALGLTIPATLLARADEVIE